jgi:hypothetical protein
VARERTHSDEHRAWWRSRWFQIAAGVGVVLCVAALIAADYVVRNAGPILKKRVIATLSERFHSPVELDTLDVSLLRGVEVRGTGLRVLYLAGPDVPGSAQIAGAGAAPMLSVKSFTFRTTLSNLVHMRARVATVYVDGMELHIPPHHGFRAAPTQPGSQPMEALMVDRIQCKDASIVIETNDPGKEPLEFAIQNLVLTDVGATQPFLYTADLINPKPVGEIHATGHFGPWQGSDPRETALDGDFTFEHADLGSIKGISGTLSSTGRFSGVLGKLVVDGTTQTPNFALDISEHPEPLETTYHAIVDGTTGDTTLAPVNATLGRSSFSCEGTIAHARDAQGNKGHDIALAVDMPDGRIQDLLPLGVKSAKPIMTAALTMHAKLHIPPGPERVAAKMELSGDVVEHGLVFSNAKVQDQIDALSMRAQGKPEEAQAAGSGGVAVVTSTLATNFALAHEVITFSSVKYAIPGANLELDGAYALRGEQFDFKGHVQTQATASQMMTGWKSMLMKPFDSLLKKNGAGLQLPIEIHGTRDDVHFGLAMHGTEETPAEMAAQMRSNPAPAKKK